MRETGFPGIARYIKDVLAQRQSQAELQAQIDALEKERLRINYEEYEFLRNSPLIDELKKAGKVLRQISTSDVLLSIYDPEWTKSFICPIDVKLMWNIEPSRILKDEFTWEEVSFIVARDSERRIVGIKCFSGTYVYGYDTDLSPEWIKYAIDRSIEHPNSRRETVSSGAHLLHRKKIKVSR